MQERTLFEFYLAIYKLPSWDSGASEAGHRRSSGRRSRRKGGQMAHTLFFSLPSFWSNGKGYLGGFQSSVLSVPKVFLHCRFKYTSSQHLLQPAMSMSQNVSNIDRSATKRIPRL
jgi:hypothetical protein